MATWHEPVFPAQFVKNLDCLYQFSSNTAQIRGLPLLHLNCFPSVATSNPNRVTGDFLRKSAQFHRFTCTCEFLDTAAQSIHTDNQMSTRQEYDVTIIVHTYPALLLRHRHPFSRWNSLSWYWRDWSDLVGLQTCMAKQGIMLTVTVPHMNSRHIWQYPNSAAQSLQMVDAHVTGTQCYQHRPHRSCSAHDCPFINSK